MPAALAIFFVMLMSMYAALNATKQEVAKTLATADASATNVIAYKSAVVTYLNANPAAIGNIPDASLTMPTGLVRLSNWTNVVVGGTLFVYEAVPSQTPSTMDLIYGKTGKSILVGKSNGTSLINAMGTNTGIPLTATIPIGSIVLVGK
jgi:hypothetical protein